MLSWMGNLATQSVQERSGERSGTSPGFVQLQTRALSPGETADSCELDGDAHRFNRVTCPFGTMEVRFLLTVGWSTVQGIERQNPQLDRTYRKGAIDGRDSAGQLWHKGR